MSTSSHWWIGWAIWGAILLVFAIAGLVWLRTILGRIRRSMRNEDVPLNLDGLE
jgi:hypothetical protein